MNFKIHQKFIVLLAAFLCMSAAKVVQAQGTDLQKNTPVSCNSAVTTVNNSDCENKEINTRLQFVWDEYFKMIEMMITLITGSLAFLAALAQFGGKGKSNNWSDFKNSTILLLLSLMLCFVWRIFAELQMESEIFGDMKKLNNYFGVQQTPDVYANFGGLTFWANTAVYTVTILKLLTIGGFFFGIYFLVRFGASRFPKKSNNKS